MTFLTTRYRLEQNLTPKDYERLRRLSTVYGIRELSIEGQRLELEYDASRFHEAEVLEQVRRAGIAVEPEKPIPPGRLRLYGRVQRFCLAYGRAQPR